MNNIPTPRTDANISINYNLCEERWVCDANFSRTLERELSETKEKLKRAELQLEQAYIMHGEGMAKEEFYKARLATEESDRLLELHALCKQRDQAVAKLEQWKRMAISHEEIARIYYGWVEAQEELDEIKSKLVQAHACIETGRSWGSKDGLLLDLDTARREIAELRELIENAHKHGAILTASFRAALSIPDTSGYVKADVLREVRSVLQKIELNFVTYGMADNAINIIDAALMEVLIN